MGQDNFKDVFPSVAAIETPCDPSPCGPNAICTDRNGAASCTCVDGYFGDPYVSGCRPECVQDSECAANKACINNKCRDPCPGTCGINAECKVINHVPACYCIRDYTGDPFVSCRRIERPPPPPPPRKKRDKQYRIL